MTHKQQVLRLLSDNQPHSHLEGYKLGVMLHSRVADLRKDGYMVKCWYENKAWMYQLFGTVREPQGAGGYAASPDGNLGVRGPSIDIGGPPETPVSTPESAGVLSPVAPAAPQPHQGGGHQLTVWEAA